MFATTGYVQGNTVLTKDYSLEKYNGRKVIITVLDEDTNNTVQVLPDEEVLKVSNDMINKNIEAYKELAN
jgi:uncharacterized FlaG/YvyC family protein